MKRAQILIGGAAALALVTSAANAEQWDMPLAYSATNFHSETAAEFGKCVTTGTGGEIETTRELVMQKSGALAGDIVAEKKADLEGEEL